MRHPQNVQSVIAYFSDLYSTYQEVDRLNQCLADISFITNEFTKNLFMEGFLFKWFPVIDISLGNHKIEYFSQS